MINKIKENWIAIVSVIFCLFLIFGTIACFSHETREIVTVKKLTWKSYVYVKELRPNYYTHQSSCPSDAYDVYSYLSYNAVTKTYSRYYDYYRNEWETIKTLTSEGTRDEKIKYKKVKLKEGQDKKKYVKYFITYKKESNGKASTEKIDKDIWDSFPEPGKKAEVVFNIFGIKEIME